MDDNNTNNKNYLRPWKKVKLIMAQITTAVRTRTSRDLGEPNDDQGEVGNVGHQEFEAHDSSNESDDSQLFVDYESTQDTPPTNEVGTEDVINPESTTGLIVPTGSTADTNININPPSASVVQSTTVLRPSILTEQNVPAASILGNDESVSRDIVSDSNFNKVIVTSRAMVVWSNPRVDRMELTNRNVPAGSNENNLQINVGGERNRRKKQPATKKHGHKNCYVLKQKDAWTVLHLELGIRYKSSVGSNIFNAARCLLSMVNIRCSLLELESNFDNPLDNMEWKSSTIRHLLNKVLEPRDYTLVPEDNKWEPVFREQKHNAIFALVISIKTPIGSLPQVCVYESASKVLIPMNNKGTVCQVGSTIIDLAKEANVQDNRDVILRTLSRHLYSSDKGSMYQIQLCAVYKLFKIVTKATSSKKN